MCFLAFNTSPKHMLRLNKIQKQNPGMPTGHVIPWEKELSQLRWEQVLQVQLKHAEGNPVIIMQKNRALQWRKLRRPKEERRDSSKDPKFMTTPHRWPCQHDLSCSPCTSCHVPAALKVCNHID